MPCFHQNLVKTDMDFPKSASHLELMTKLHITQKEIFEIIEMSLLINLKTKKNLFLAI
jgi:hypothetical protein